MGSIDGQIIVLSNLVWDDGSIVFHLKHGNKNLLVYFRKYERGGGSFRYGFGFPRDFHD
jgi:hypothetical protein